MLNISVGFLLQITGDLFLLVVVGPYSRSNPYFAFLQASFVFLLAAVYPFYLIAQSYCHADEVINI